MLVIQSRAQSALLLRKTNRACNTNINSIKKNLSFEIFVKIVTSNIILAMINKLDQQNEVHQFDEMQYDQFLIKQKNNTFKRIEKFKTMSTNIKHQCNICSRIWKPSPKKCLADDYYCPSCVLHHRNNVERFKDEKLKWTADVPNTFYLFEITDVNTKVQFYKYGRTQHQQPQKRYSTTEKSRYNMKLIYNSRGRLKNMTIIENLWKNLAKDFHLKPKFSEEDFHGATQCIILNEELLKLLLYISEELLMKNLSELDDFRFRDLTLAQQKQIKELVESINK